MALKTGIAVSIVGPVGPASIVTVSAPPGPNVGVVGGFAVWPPSSGNGNVVILYGPKTANGWTQTTDGNGNSTPVGFQLTGAVGQAGAAGAAGTNGTNGTNGVDGATIRSTSGVPANTVGNVNDIAIDSLQGFVYGPKKADGTWPTTPLVSTVGPAGPKGDVGAAATLPNDYTGNSFVVQPVANDANAVQFAIKNSAGTVLWSADASGNTTVGGTLKVNGASTLAAVSATTLNTSGAATLGSTLAVTGSTTLASASCTAINSTGNASVGGTLGVTGATTLAGVTASSASVNGNASIGGTLGVTGAATLAGASCTTLAASSNATVGGTLGVTGSATLAGASCTSLAASGNATIGGTLGVTGASSVAALTASGLITAPNITLTSGANGKLTFADGTSMTTAATGTGGGSSGGGTGGVAFVDLGFYWPNAGAYPTSLTPNVRTITSGSTVATVQAVTPMPSSGSILGINGFIFSNTGGKTYTFTLYKNGTATNITATANSTTATAITGSLSGTLYQSSASLSAVNYVAGDVLQIYSMAESGATSQATYSFASYATAASSVGSGSATGSRFAISAGGFYSSNAAANALYTLEETSSNDANLTTSPAVIHTFGKIPFGFSLTGWSVNQYVNNGANSFQVTKNRTSSTLNSILTQAVGTPSVSGFPGNQFSGTWTKGTYVFAAGDTFNVVYQHSTGTTTNVKMTLYGEWT